MQNRIAILSMLAVLTLGLADAAQAQPSDYRTYFTFSAPVTLPGTTLPAGRYLFRVANLNGDRKVINVLSGDGRTSLAMLHTIPNQLPKPPEDPEVRFMETAANVPPAIKTWWYPGRSIGYEFIYPRQQALQLAKTASAPVLTTSAETNDFEKAELARIAGSGAPSPVTVEENPAPVEAVGRAQQGEVASGADVAQGPAPNPRTDEPPRTVARAELPQTASSTPLVVLLGGLTMFAGLGLSFWRPRNV